MSKNRTYKRPLSWRIAISKALKGRPVPSRLGLEKPSTRKSSTRPTYGDIRQAVGFLEGEGWFGGQNGTQQVHASQAHSVEPLKQLLAWFGGSITPKGKQDATWGVYGSRARGVMMTLFTFMSPRRKAQIKEALCGVRSQPHRAGPATGLLGSGRPVSRTRAAAPPAYLHRG